MATSVRSPNQSRIDGSHGSTATMRAGFGKPFERLRFEPPRIAPAITKICLCPQLIAIASQRIDIDAAAARYGPEPAGAGLIVEIAAVVGRINGPGEYALPLPADHVAAIERAKPVVVPT